MGKMKAMLMAELEANPISHERYWLSELQCHEPVLPDTFFLLSPQAIYDEHATSDSTQTPLEPSHVFY